MILGNHKLFILLTFIGILSIKPNAVSGVRVIAMELRLDHRILKAAVLMEDHEGNSSPAVVNKKLDSYEASKRTVRRGSDPIHNRA
ncbi:hypothetical protein SSX86_020838 [Deinandra increscens subsp. villosa]|uniref:Uncharacterized protein n=1 Tax=Deinandra increscens subsp. villosa TaxID=3103831 RepID=A0AAP0GTT4_9ASTR